MSDWITVQGPERAVYVFGTRMVGMNADNGKKLLFTPALIAFLLLLGWALRALTRVVLRLETRPRAYWRLTDNWLELTVRFVVRDRGIREVKDSMARDLLKALDAAGIGIATKAFEITGLPPLRVEAAAGFGHILTEK